VRSFLALAAALLASLTLAACSGGDSVSLESVANAATRTESAGSSRMALVMSMDVQASASTYSPRVRSTTSARGAGWTWI
jgi:hypothetical protein